MAGVHMDYMCMSHVVYGHAHVCVGMWRDARGQADGAPRRLHSHHHPLHSQVHFGAMPEDKLMARLDAAIGRTAHINFLDNDTFVQMFVHAYLGFFA